MKQKSIPLPVVAVIFFFVLLTFFISHIPFFWDELYYIGTAFGIHDSGFASFVPPVEHDRGNFPFYGFYMALWWTIFGKSLAVSHFAMLPVLAGIIWEYFMIAKKIIPVKWIPFALLLLVIEPTLGTQSILMGHDLFLLYFFMLSFRATLYERRTLYAFGILLLAFHNVKGVPFAFVLALFYFLDRIFFEKRELKFFDYIIHLIPVLAWGVWMIYHKKITGWYILTPVGDYGSGLHTDLSFFKRIILSLWQIADFGRIFLVLPVFSLFFFPQKLEHPLKKIIFACLITVVISVAFFSLMDISLCHRYFLPVFLLLGILACAWLANFVRLKWRWLIAVMISFGLITGNFWIYGGGFSNGWDASLKVLPYFQLKNKMDEFIVSSGIPVNEVGTKYPLYQDTELAYLNTEGIEYVNMNNDLADSYKYVLLSNISNLFTVDEKQKLGSKWKLLKEFSSGQVYIKLFQNPEQ